MLTIKLNPVRSDNTPLFVSWISPVLTVNGTQYDLSELPDGAEAEHQVLGTVMRNVDDYSVIITLPHGPNAPYETRFPTDVVMSTNGIVPIPPYDEVG